MIRRPVSTRYAELSYVSLFLPFMSRHDVLTCVVCARPAIVFSVMGKLPACSGADRLTEVDRLKLVLDYERLQNVTEVAKKHGVGRNTVRQWVNSFKATCSIAAKPGAGRNASLSAAVVDQATDMLVSGKFAGTQHVAIELQNMGVSTSTKPLHMTTISRLVKASGEELGVPVKVLSGEPEKELSSSTKRKRLQFVVENKATCWRKVMLTDRKKFIFKYPGCHVKRYSWVRKGGKREAKKASRLDGVNGYAGITEFGITKVHCVAGTHNMKTTHTNLKGQGARSITKSECKEVLLKTLLPGGKKLFRKKDITRWIFQQDNDPAHNEAATIIKAWNGQHNRSTVKLLEGWPGNNPDLNCIENLWDWAQAKVDAKGCKTIEEFKKCVIDTMEKVP